MLGDVQAPGRRKHEPAHALRMLEREARRHRAAQRMPRERELADPEAIEELEVVQVVVVAPVDGRIVARSPESRMVRHDQPHALRQRQEDVEAGHRAATVEEHERRALPGTEHGGVDAVDVVALLDVGRSHAGTAAGRMSRIASSVRTRVSAPSAAAACARQAT